MRTSVAIALAAVMIVGSAEAKPKVSGVGMGGCTAAQIQKWGNTGAGKACLDANESGGAAEAQTLYCSSDGAILCCKNEGADRHDCTVIGHDIASHPANGTFSNSPGAQNP